MAGKQHGETQPFSVIGVPKQPTASGGPSPAAASAASVPPLIDMDKIDPPANRDTPLFDPSDEKELDSYQNQVEDLLVESSSASLHGTKTSSSLLNDLLDISPFLSEAVSAIVDVSTRPPSHT